jgi:hypothetical protein
VTGADAATISLRFTETQMPVGTTASIVNLGGAEYTGFGITTLNMYRYHDSLDPFSDGAGNEGGTNPYGLSPRTAAGGRIDFTSVVGNLQIDWWTLARTLDINVFSPADQLLATVSGVGPAVATFNFGNIGYVTFNDGVGGVGSISNIRFETDAVVPEPATLALLGAGLGASALSRRRRKGSRIRR